MLGVGNRMNSLSSIHSVGHSFNNYSVLSARSQVAHGVEDMILLLGELSGRDGRQQRHTQCGRVTEGTWGIWNQPPRGFQTSQTTRSENEASENKEPRC